MAFLLHRLCDLCWDWVLSRDAETVIAELIATPRLWDAIRALILGDAQVLVDQARAEMREECAAIVDEHAADVEAHEGYCYGRELRDIAAAIRARGTDETR